MNKDFTKALKQITAAIALAAAMTFTGITVCAQGVESIPEEIRATPGNVTLNPVHVIEQGEIPALENISDGYEKEVFAAPPCLPGQYYVGIQLYYDLLYDQQTLSPWTASLDVTLYHQDDSLWTKTLAVNMTGQTFIATVFYPELLSCDSYYHIKVSNKQVTNDAPQESIYLKLLLYKHNEDIFDPELQPSVGYGYNSLEDVDSVYWDYSGKAVINYDVEWVFIEDHEHFTGTTAQAAFAFKEPVGITTAGISYKHLVYYPKGRLWYRVRAVGYNPQYPKHRIYGAWSYGPGTAIVTASHERQMNWQAQTVFAEEGKYKKVMNYFDGTLRLRQVQTHLSTQEVALVAETFYDYEGRKAVDVLATPVPDSRLRYKPGLNVFAASNQLITNHTSDSLHKFHYDNGRVGNSILSASSGASQYYSPFNTMDSRHKNYIPDGEGYVYVQTEYTRDGTGRVSRQSGVGETFRIDGDHTTQYFYGTATREELVRLFGPNVGHPSHYKKNSVVDANGQVSVTYVDQEGRTIATALAGNPPSNVDTLQSFRDLDPDPITINLNTHNKKQGNQSEVIQTIVNTTPGTEYTFHYDLSASGSPLEEIGCQACKFDVFISITDPDDSLVNLGSIPGNESADTYHYIRKNLTADSCSTPTGLTDITFTTTFNRLGDYTVSKLLTAHELTFEQMRTIVSRKESVVETISRIVQNHPLDSAGCEICTDCEEAETAFDEAIDEIAEMDCENILQQIRQQLDSALHAQYPDSTGYEPSPAQIEQHPLHCKYLRCTEDQASDAFEKRLVKAEDWDEAIAAGYTDLINTDPFFNDPALNGYAYKTQMQNKLNDIVVGTMRYDQNQDGVADGTREIRGPLEAVTDPANTNYYYDNYGNLNTNGTHVLYTDLMVKRHEMDTADYALEISEQRWTMYRNFYKQTKTRVIREFVEAYRSCQAAMDELNQVPETVEEIEAAIASHPPDTVTEEDLDMSLFSIRSGCKIVLSASDSVAMRGHLKEYFTDHPENQFHFILTEDLSTDPNLQAVQNILNNYNCGLDTAVAVANPITCAYDTAFQVAVDCRKVQKPSRYNVQWLDMLGVSNNNGVLTKTSSGSWGTAGATSSNLLPANTDGWIEFTTTEATRTSRPIIGFGTMEGSFNTTDLEYAFNLTSESEGMALWVMVNGANAQQVSTWAVGDTYRLSREGNQMKYYRNGALIFTASATGRDLKVKSVLERGSSPVVRSSFGIQLSVNAVKTGVHPDGTGGGIALAVAGGSPAYSYYWSSVETTSSISGKQKGFYQVTAADGDCNIVSRSYYIGHAVEWVDLNGVTESGGALTKTSTNTWANATSANVLPANTDGWFEFVADASTRNSNFMIGFTTCESCSSDLAIESGLALNADSSKQRLRSFESGEYSAELSSWFVGDVFRISREGGQVKYYRNGVEIRSVSVSSNTALHIGAVVFNGTTPIVTSSFDITPILQAIVTPVNDGGTGGSIQLVVSGGSTPYSYQWSSGENGSTIENKGVGAYTVMVTDAEGRTTNRVYNIGYKTYWKTLLGVAVTTNGALTKTAPEGWDNGGATSYNNFPAHQDGWFEFVIQDVTSSYAVGFSSSNNITVSSIEEGLVISNRGQGFPRQVVDVVESSSEGMIVGAWRRGDVFKVAREGSTVKYYRNGSELRSIEVDADRHLKVSVVVNNGHTPVINTSSQTLTGQGMVPDAIELSVLKDIYDSLGGINWANKTNWPTPGNWPASATSAVYGTWYGVMVSDGDIVQLNLNQNNLLGEIPSSIGTLHSLNNLVLYGNSIAGSISPAVGYLSNLHVLHLSYNQLSGSIPSELGNLLQLRQLGLDNNRLTGVIPSSIGRLSNLTLLQLSSNLLSGNIPSSLGALTNLQQLHLNYNLLTGLIPSTFGKLRSLTHLVLFANSLSGTIPASLGDLSNLRVLHLSYNHLSGSIPLELGRLSLLQQFFADNNQLSGNIPSTFGDLSSLTFLQLSSNRLSGSIPSSLGALENLQQLHLNYNQLTGSIPSTLGGMHSLTNLVLFNNSLTGSIPPSIGDLSNLRVLYLSYNQLTGAIPTEIGSLFQLQQFFAENNRLTNSLPATIGNLSNLTSLHLPSNLLAGNIPESIASLQSLTHIDVSNNDLTSFPDFSDFPNKASLAIKINGNRIPYSYVEHYYNNGTHGFREFAYAPQKDPMVPSTVHYNVVTYNVGELLVIPAVNSDQYPLMNWQKQQPDGTWLNVNATNQDATGKTYTRVVATSTDAGVYRWAAINSVIPDITIQSGLISVQYRQVSDEVELQILKNLYDSLGGAGWTTKTNWPTPGNWPASASSAEFGTWYGVVVTNGDITGIALAGNNVTGRIPSTISQLTELRSIWLSNNSISGFSDQLFTLPELNRIFLDNNQLTGSIPSVTGSASITELWLNNNQLTGNIPPSLASLSGLQVLNLSNNNLSGVIPGELTQLKLLSNLNLSNNGFTGSIPSNIGALTNLTHLYLYENQLGGSIPVSMGNLNKLVDVRLQANTLTGAIPDVWDSLQDIQTLLLSGNQLTGEIPSSMGGLSRMTLLRLNNNLLSGNVPSSFSGLTNLAKLYLHDNHLSGNIDFVSSLTRLTELIINDNSFSGDFPSLGALVHLQYLASQNNKFTRIPVDILGLGSLVSVNFNNNGLRTIPNFAAHVNKANLQLVINNNYLDFSHLEPLVTTSFGTLSYAPQKSISDASVITLSAGDTLRIPSRNPGQHSTVVWEKLQSNGSWLNVNAANEDPTLYTYRKREVQAVDSGTYRWSMTNSVVTNITLRSLPIKVNVSRRVMALKEYRMCLEYDTTNATLDKLSYTIQWSDQIKKCLDNQVKEDSILIQMAVARMLEEEVTTFYNKFRTNCLHRASENLTYTYVSKEHHYTLYYYDQAGNLVQTVPPQGVHPLTTEEIAAGASPTHTLVTQYAYNSLNALRHQSTPDAGESRFWYDSKGRLRFSQNAQQQLDQRYSYTKYDNQGRIIEVGELETAQPLAFLLVQADALTFPSPGLPDYPLFDITRTHYDVPADTLANEGVSDPFIQENLRSRVSWVEVIIDSLISTDSPLLWRGAGGEARTLYSYDVHGNVKALQQQLPGLGMKRTDYVYDLVSGKVNYVFYQYGHDDQFIHRYEYDADNRITDVYTSSDGFLWNKEATYDYYLHGPLARTELGEYRVQGTDYYYTLQGWIKGVNMPGVGDPGNDGIGSSKVGKDVFAYTLGYYQSDYKPINSSVTLSDMRDKLWERFSETITPLSFGEGPGVRPGLYNGNISWMTTQLAKTGEINNDPARSMQAMLYRYDQLHRIVRSRSLTDYDPATGFAARNPNGPVGERNKAYDEDYTYDANGNILTLERNDELAALADDFDYTYYDSTNRLKSVDPAMDTIYTYDAIGNLVHDRKEGVTISWTPYGKVRQVQKGDSLIVTYRYDATGNRIEKRVRSLSFGEGWGEATTHYVRDASGNVMAIYSDTTLSEQPIYGSSRLGQYKGQVKAGHRTLGRRHYELSNHLGNVLALITDNVGMVEDSVWATVVSVSDYYPFGLEMKGRTWSDTTSRYRYGFNGKEKDENGEFGNTVYDYGFRIYNPSIGKFLSVDPLTKQYPWYTPYQFAGNTPIQAVDLDGLEELHYIAYIDRTGKLTGLEFSHEKDIKETVITGTINFLGFQIPQTRDEIVNRRKEYVIHYAVEGYGLHRTDGGAFKKGYAYREVGTKNYGGNGGILTSHDRLEKDGDASFNSYERTNSIIAGAGLGLMIAGGPRNPYSRTSVSEGEVFFRTMSRGDYEEFLKTGRVRATGETFTSPTAAFSENYEGVMVQFNLKPGTTKELMRIGVRDPNHPLTEELGLPAVQKGWNKSNAFFKEEGGQVNIGLGQGEALDVFNNNIQGHTVIRK